MSYKTSEEKPEVTTINFHGNVIIMMDPYNSTKFSFLSSFLRWTIVSKLDHTS